MTDANVVLGRIGRGQSLGDSLRIDHMAADTVVGTLADRTGLDLDAAAAGVIDLAVTKMSAAVHEISLARGYDPRDLVLLPFGGAGPLHACLIADQLGIPKVLIPPVPGAFSAFGGLCAELFEERQETVLLTLDDEGCTHLAAVAEHFEHELRDTLSADGFEQSRVDVRIELDARYEGQSHELTVLVAELDTTASVRTVFEAEFKRQFGRLDVGRALQVVNLRVIASVKANPPLFSATMTGAPIGVGVPHGGPRLTRDGELPVHKRDEIGADQSIDGPAIIQEMTATTYLPDGWTLHVGKVGELVLSAADQVRGAVSTAVRPQNGSLAAT